jgi:Homeodomain-like domain
MAIGLLRHLHRHPGEAGCCPRVDPALQHPGNRGVPEHVRHHSGYCSPSLILRLIPESMLPATLEVHRDRETTGREEVHRKAQGRRARAAQRADPKGQKPGPSDAEGTHPAEGDASEAGEAWSDGRIAEALDTSIDTIARTRQQLVEGGIDAALTRKHSPNSARRRIFDGVAEAKLIALACSPPSKGRKRWTLTLLETSVVELNIVDRASDNTIGRTLKKTRSSRTFRSNGSSRQRPTLLS